MSVRPIRFSCLIHSFKYRIYLIEYHLNHPFKIHVSCPSHIQTSHFSVLKTEILQKYYQSQDVYNPWNHNVLEYHTQILCMEL